MQKVEFEFNYSCEEALKKKHAEILSSKVIQDNMLRSHRQYEIRIKKQYSLEKMLEENTTFTIYRRYSDFAYIHKKIKYNYPFLILPALPEKHYLNLVGISSEEQEEMRKNELEIYINKILSISNWDKIRELKEIFSNVC